MTTGVAISYGDRLQNAYSWWRGKTLPNTIWGLERQHETMGQTSDTTGRFLRVLVFGAESAVLGKSEVQVPSEANVHTVADLKRWLAREYPQLASAMPGIRVAINHRFAADDTAIRPEDEVALIGRVSGG